jgi:hypothetical protein
MNAHYLLEKLIMELSMILTLQWINMILIFHQKAIQSMVNHLLYYLHSDHITPKLLVVFKVANAQCGNRCEDWC